jgi:multimeric flavodoxin WrbA
MKVVAFNGSPRKDGNCSVLIDTVFAVLEKQGIQTQKIDIGVKQLQGCIACMKCWENKDQKCALKNDQINDWLKIMLEADGIILASPVYCAGPNAQIKALIDRTSMVACANDDMLQRKLGASVVAVRRAGSVQTFSMLNSYFTITQMITVGSTYWNMGFGMEKGEVLKDEEGLQTMRNLGKNMAWLLKCIEYAKTAVETPFAKKEISTNFIR